MIEEMSQFFTARVEGYDAHMLCEVEGCREGYARMAALVPDGARDLLDLGCGTGLELDAIFARRPDLRVTGIDLTPAMLDKLRQKHPERALNLICASYFDVDFGIAAYDCAVSFQSLHHFTPETKLGLYRRVRQALRPGGVYLECDYMVEDPQEEAFYFAENARLRAEQGLDPDAFAHYDTPLTVAHQLDLLRKAGFASVQKLWRQENTTLLLAQN
jgi:tRNA (cmo5U34)-methyltransferase